MILFILLQFFHLGLTGMINHDPPYLASGPRNIITLYPISRIDNTYVAPKKNCGKIVHDGLTGDGWYYFIVVENDSTLNRRKFIIEEKEFYSLNLQNPFCVDSLNYW
jgi:hypothetical protein